MRFIDRFLEGVLEALHGRFDGLPLDRIRREARELLEAELLDLDATLELFLERLGVCRRCGNAWPDLGHGRRGGPGRALLRL
jgi:hypothetical protein